MNSLSPRTKQSSRMTLSGKCCSSPWMTSRKRSFPVPTEPQCQQYRPTCALTPCRCLCASASRPTLPTGTRSCTGSVPTPEPIRSCLGYQGPLTCRIRSMRWIQKRKLKIRTTTLRVTLKSSRKDTFSRGPSLGQTASSVWPQ
ncbi:unnamed protein product, partial [Ixodes pacificus]